MSIYPDDSSESEIRNKRKERRWNIPVPVRVTGTLADGSTFDEETVTADASPSGMCVLLTASVAVQQGQQVRVSAAEEKFESTATIQNISSLGPHMNRLRLRFPASTRFSRAAAPKQYVYDYATESWVGYMFEGIYYNTKHEPFGKIEEKKIFSIDTGRQLFLLRGDRMFDLRGSCVGHIV